METSTLADLLTEQNNLSTLSQAVEAADLGSALSGDTELTVFAPSDAAFGALTVDVLLNNPDLLAQVLQYHIVEGVVESGDLSDGQTIETLQGDELTVSISDGSVSINGATVTTPDVPAQNGIAHVIDGVLLENRTILERLSVTAATQTLAGAVDDAGLAQTLNDADATFTVFAPTEDAFEGVDLSGLSQDDLRSILEYHVIAGAAVSSSAIENGQTAQTVQGTDVTFTIDGETIRVNDAAVARPDLGVSNGIVHQIDGVLMPMDP